MNTKFNALDILTMSEVGERIKFKNSETTKNWCITNNLSVHKFSNRDYVYRIDLEFTIGKAFVADLKNKHPQQWKILLKEILGNDALYNLFLANLDESRDLKPLTMVKPMCTKEREMYKKLIS